MFRLASAKVEKTIWTYLALEAELATLCMSCNDKMYSNNTPTEAQRSTKCRATIVRTRQPAGIQKESCLSPL